MVPWNNAYYPASMKNLAPQVGAKAIEIANSLLEEGVSEGSAIRIGIARARQWAERRHVPTGTSNTGVDW